MDLCSARFTPVLFAVLLAVFIFVSEALGLAGLWVKGGACLLLLVFTAMDRGRNRYVWVAALGLVAFMAAWDLVLRRYTVGGRFEMLVESVAGGDYNLRIRHVCDDTWAAAFYQSGNGSWLVFLTFNKPDYWNASAKALQILNREGCSQATLILCVDSPSMVELDELYTRLADKYTIKVELRLVRWPYGLYLPKQG